MEELRKRAVHQRERKDSSDEEMSNLREDKANSIANVSFTELTEEKLSDMAGSTARKSKPVRAFEIIFCYEFRRDSSTICSYVTLKAFPVSWCSFLSLYVCKQLRCMFMVWKHASHKNIHVSQGTITIGKDGTTQPWPL